MNGGERQAALDRARRGDAQALGACWKAIGRMSASWSAPSAIERLRARLDGSDLIQDALLEVHRCFAQFRGAAVAELTAWLRQIVLRTAGRTLRGQLGTEKRDAGREQAAGDAADFAASDGSTPSTRRSVTNRRRRMAEALARLPDDMQQVLLGRHTDDLSYAVLADQLGRSEAAVRVLYTRALRRLRVECREPDEPAPPPGASP